MTPERIKDGLLDVALELEKKQHDFAEKQGIRLYGELTRLGLHGSEAICHSKILEAYALPGQLIIGSDSHTPHCRGGRLRRVRRRHDGDLQLVDHEGRARHRAAETVQGRGARAKPANVTAKDFMLEILRHPYVKSGQAIGKIVEYCGDGGRGAVGGRARHHDEHGGRGRRVHGHRRAGREDGRRTWWTTAACPAREAEALLRRPGERSGCRLRAR